MFIIQLFKISFDIVSKTIVFDINNRKIIKLGYYILFEIFFIIYLNIYIINKEYFQIRNIGII